MTTAVVINAASGTAREYGAAALQDVIRSAAVAAGRSDVQVRVVPPKQLPAALIAAAETSDEIWVGGGDGTLRSAAELVMRRDGVLGVLPLGTMNLLARDLKFIDAADASSLEAEIISVRRMLGTFLSRVRSNGRTTTEDRQPKAEIP